MGSEMESKMTTTNYGMEKRNGRPLMSKGEKVVCMSEGYSLLSDLEKVQIQCVKRKAKGR